MTTSGDVPPAGSIYFWMHQQGLYQVPPEQVVAALEGREIRPKDWDNYWRGWYKSSLYHRRDVLAVGGGLPQAARMQSLTDYPEHPYLAYPEVQERWVPCTGDGKPLIRWGSGCLTKTDALATKGCETLAENLKGTRRIVVDIDGDHDPEHVDEEVIRYFWKYHELTHVLAKDTGTEIPLSYHLTFTVDRLVPTQHYPAAHIDVVGNARNSIRYFKRKRWNHVPPARLTPEIWDDIMGYVKGKESGGVG